MNERINPHAPLTGDVRDQVRRVDENTAPAATGAGAVLGGVAGGMAGAAAAGAAIGGMTGPVGAAVGAVAGAVVGALAGKGLAKPVDPAAEEAYWRDNYATRPYAHEAAYHAYQPAFGLGVDAFSRYPGQDFAQFEPHLEREWASRRGNSS
ncbi:MAG: hypothetical protein ABIR55_13865, partial [Burkholderiaceae bacterium]